MAEPATHSQIVATAVKSAASGTGIAATLPIDPITMIFGLVAALTALLHITPPEGEHRTPVRVFLLVASSGFLAGVFVPVVVAGGVNYLPWLTTVPDLPLQWAAAAAIGAAPHVAPTLWRLWREAKGGAR